MMNKIEVFMFGFSNLIMVSGTNGVDVVLEKQRDVVFFVFLEAALILYVQGGHFEPALSLYL